MPTVTRTASMLEVIRQDLESIRAELLRAFIAANGCHHDARVQQLSRKFDRVLNLYMRVEKSGSIDVHDLEHEATLPNRTASSQP